MPPDEESRSVDVELLSSAFIETLTGFEEAGAEIGTALEAAGVGFRCKIVGFARMTGGGAAGLLNAAIRSLNEPVDALGLAGTACSDAGSDFGADTRDVGAFGSSAGGRTGAAGTSAATGCGGAMTAAAGSVDSSIFSMNCSGTACLLQYIRLFEHKRSHAHIPVAPVVSFVPLR